MQLNSLPLPCSVGLQILSLGSDRPAGKPISGFSADCDALFCGLHAEVWNHHAWGVDSQSSNSESSGSKVGVLCQRPMFSRLYWMIVHILLGGEQESGKCRNGEIDLQTG